MLQKERQQQKLLLLKHRHHKFYESLRFEGLEVNRTTSGPRAYPYILIKKTMIHKVSTGIGVNPTASIPIDMMMPPCSPRPHPRITHALSVIGFLRICRLNS